MDILPPKLQTKNFAQWLKASIAFVLSASLTSCAVADTSAKDNPPAPADAPSSMAAVKNAAPTHPAGKTLDTLVGNWLRRPDMQHSMYGIEVMEVPSGKVLYSYNGERRFTTASTAKVFPTACAYETFGPTYTYKTQFATSGTVDGSHVHGDLLVNPSEDPTLGRDGISQMVAALAEKKITHIDGTIKLAHTPGGDAQFYTGWLPEDWGQSWMPVCSDLVIDRNVAQGVPAFHSVKQINVPLEGDWNALFSSLMKSEQASAWVSYDPAQRALKLFCGKGTTPKSPLCVANPDEYNIEMISSMLEDNNIHVGTQPLKAVAAQVKHAEKPHTATGTITPTPATALSATNPATTSPGKPSSWAAGDILAEHQSKPLSNIIQTCLHESDNLYAQQLLRTLGLLNKDEANKLGKSKELPQIEDRGLYRMGNWMTKFGVPAQEAMLYDGCGLSRKNCISPHALNCVLNHMQASPALKGYISLLKTAGGSNDGRGAFHYKTGTMDSVSSIAGILQTMGGQTLAVTVIVNGHTRSVKRARSWEMELIALLDSITTIGATIDKPAFVSEVNSAPPVEVTSTQPLPSARRTSSSSHSSGSHKRRRRH